jgi:Fic family protein
MTERTLEALSAGELAEIDAQYVPFPPFSEWPQRFPHADSWQRARDELQAAADEATEEDLQRAQGIARRVAAFDTGAIEGLYATNRGLTFTVAEQAASWEQKVDAQGPEARALFEAQLRAFELVLDHVTDRLPVMAQAWLRRLHEEITAPQETYVVHTPVGSQEQPLPKGEYKKHPNHVRTSSGGIHAYAPVGSTQSEMQRLVEEVETAEFGRAHPVIQAAYVHYALVAIHPFADGNGRVARAAASVYTYRDASIPLIVLNEHRDEYFTSLAEADAGSPEAFVGFIARVTREALDLVRDTLQTARAPQPEDLLEEFGELYREQERLEQRDLAVRSFMDWLVKDAESHVARLEIPLGVKIDVEGFNETSQPPPPGYRNIDVDGVRSFRFYLKSAPPANATEPRRINVFVARDSANPEGVLLQVVQTSEELALARSDIVPQLSSLAEHRIENFVHRILGEGLEQLLLEARKQIGS